MAIAYQPETKARIEAARAVVDDLYEQARLAYNQGDTVQYRILRDKAEDARATVKTLMTQGHIETIEVLGHAHILKQEQIVLGLEAAPNVYGRYTGKATGLSLKPDGTAVLMRYQWYHDIEAWVHEVTVKLSRHEAGALLAALSDWQTS